MVPVEGYANAIRVDLHQATVNGTHRWQTDSDVRAIFGIAQRLAAILSEAVPVWREATAAAPL